MKKRNALSRLTKTIGDASWSFLTVFFIRKHHIRVSLNPFITKEDKISRINKASTVTGYYATEKPEDTPFNEIYSQLVNKKPFAIWYWPDKFSKRS